MAGTKSTIDAQGQASDDAGVMLKMKDTKIRILEEQVDATTRHEMSVRLRCDQQLLGCYMVLPLLFNTKLPRALLGDCGINQGVGIFMYRTP